MEEVICLLISYFMFGVDYEVLDVVVLFCFFELVVEWCELMFGSLVS